jgi:hypothetical protein
MKLKDFLENFVEPNSSIRLWKNIGNGQHKMLADNQHTVMDHELLHYNTVLSEYLTNDVEHVFSVLVPGSFADVINISIKI